LYPPPLLFRLLFFFFFCLIRYLYTPAQSGAFTFNIRRNGFGCAVVEDLLERSEVISIAFSDLSDILPLKRSPEK
ncbi:hypothetical protein C4869_20445, partial [Salmonella enterica subsp. enterica serovar Anatum]|uniref:hypothetical protein n=1 Tax=Salmonella enterica TaxID=28901 RepID=UPI000D608530